MRSMTNGRPAAPAAGSPPGGRVTSVWGRIATAAAGVLGAAFVTVVAMAAPAWAHAMLVSSSPADGAVVSAPPRAATLVFDEPVRPVPADIVVLDPHGRSVGGAVTAAGPKVVVALPRAGVQGTYTLSWRVISADSHPVGGAITFSVGHPSRSAGARSVRTSRAVAALFAFARFAAFAGFAVFAGVIAFCCYGLPRVIGLHRVRLLIVAGWAMLVAGTFGALMLQGPYAAGAGLGGLVRPGLLGQTLAGAYGKALTARILMLGLTPFLLAYGVPRLEGATRAGRLLIGGAGSAVLVALAVTWSVGGHAATSGRPYLTVPVDVAHLCAMALWLGGLIAMTVVSRAAWREPDVAAGLDRFSAMAATCVAVLAVTGLYQAWVRVQTPAALLTTPYGITLTVKVVLVGLVLSVAFFSRRTLRRRSSALPASRLASLVAVEAVGAIVVVAVTALLVEMEPAAQALAAKPVTLTARFATGSADGTGNVRLRLPDQARGLSTATVTVQDAGGRLRDVAELDVAWSLPERHIGPIAARVGHDGTGRYTARTAPISATGRWRIAITIRTGDIDETTVNLSQTIR